MTRIIYGSRGPTRNTQDVFIQDQTTDTVILPLVQQLGLSTLALETVREDYNITVVDGTQFVVGNHIRIINANADRYYSGYAVSVAGNVVGLDSPLDFEYIVGSEVTASNDNLAVNGSITPVHFHLRTGSPSIPSSIDITRMMMVCEAPDPVALNLFGSVPSLTRGIVFRIENGKLRNIFNVKNNRDLVGLAFDWTPYGKTKPNEGIDGFSWRLTFNGQSKMGVSLRVEKDGQLGMIVQDDLSGLIDLKCIVEGHIVE